MLHFKISSDALSTLKEWLNRDEEALLTLKSVAKSVIGWAKGDSRIYDLLCIEKDDPTPELGVIAFILEFLFDENKLKSCRTQLVEYIETDNFNGFRSILVSRIINHCRDERRKEDNSPFHSCYRKMSNALCADSKRQDSETKYVYRNETGAYFAVSKSKLLGFVEKGRLSADNFRGWPDPGFAVEELKWSSVHVAISRIFWRYALEELKQEHFLPIIEVVSYMDANYGFSKVVQSETASNSDDGEFTFPTHERLHHWQSHDTLGTLAKQDAVAEIAIMNSTLESAAVRLAQSWKPIMRVCFFYYHVLELTLDETAIRTGLTSPQSASYHVNKAMASLKEFTLQWNVAGYEDEKPSHEEKKVVFSALIDFILKNHPECRDEE